MIESKQELLRRISVDSSICFGKPCVKGHRIWVSLILDMLAEGVSYEQVLENYPRLTQMDRPACIAYGSEMSRERFVDLPHGAPRSRHLNNRYAIMETS